MQTTSLGYEVSVPIINACFPRSGHRFLREILARYLDEQFVFYESYEQRTISTKTGVITRSQANYIKTHDFDLKGRKVLDNFFPPPRAYVVQIRHPITAIASYYEFSIKHGEIRKDTESTWEKFLKHKLDYWREFYRLWASNQRDSTLIILYENLEADPKLIVGGAIEFITGQAVDAQRLDAALKDGDFLQYVGDQTSRKSSIRRIQNFHHYDELKFKEIEDELTPQYFQPIGMPRLFADI